MHAKQCIYALSGGEMLILGESFEEAAKMGFTPEQKIVTRHFVYFGPPTEGLFKQIDSEEWRENLEITSRVAERALEAEPELRFECWGKVIGPQALDMISGMTNPDPTARPTIEQVLEHPWWQEDDEE
jgi:hypothetical protein